MNLGPLAIGAGHPCRIVAELSNAHNGDLDRALTLIEAVKDAGADAVKFQAYTPDELVALRGDGPAPNPWGSQGWTMRQLYEKAQTPLAWFPKLVRHCREVGIPWFSSVFGLESLACLEALGCPAYKIARLDNHHHDFIGAVRSAGKPLIVSASEDRPYHHGTLQRAPFVLYCPPGYPTPEGEVHLPWRFGGDEDYYGGLSSHCLAPELPVAAVARGCKLIEMHVMLAEEPSELESDVSLNEHQLEDLVRSVRCTEEMLA